MSGEIATAYIALMPSMRRFGSEAARQIGPQAKTVGAKAGQQAGAAFSSAASKESGNWLASTAKEALKNVTLYGSMYKIIQGVGTGISAMFDSMIGFNAELEQASIGFETMLGSSKAARDEMQWIKDFAKETPFQYEDLVKYSQQLLALGFDAKQAQDVLQATGDAAAALGRGSESIARINLALGQMWTKGKVQSQEMLQLTEAGISAWQILADAYGTTVDNVQKAVTAGEIKAADAVPALIAGMNARFGGLMEKQSQTYAGIVSNIQDTLQQQLASAGEPLFRELTADAKKLLNSLSDPEVVKVMNAVGKSLATGARALAEAVKYGWQFRDAIFEIGVAIAASKLLTRVTAGSMLSAKTWFDAAEAQRAYAAGLKATTALRAGLTDKGFGAALGIAKVAGLIGVVDGYRRVANAGDDATKATLGFAEATAGGAVAGAAFGSVLPGIGTAAGAAIGAIGGLALSLWSYKSAADAANKDTSLAQQAFRDMGVDANLAALAIAGVTNKEFEAAGGVNKLLDAMRSGTYDDYVSGLKDQLASTREQADALNAQILELDNTNHGAITDTEAYDAMLAKWRELSDRGDQLDALLKDLEANSSALAAANDQVVASAYQSAYAADLQTGSLGAMAEAAWKAVEAEGGLSNEALAATARMEGLAGVAGYATQMIAGIPTGTQINFNTNASDILQKIIRLRAAAEAMKTLPGAGSYNPYATTIKQLEDEYNRALQQTSTTLSLPSSAKVSGGVAKAVSTAAQDAARKLEQDRAAQVRFGDAFGTLMESALAGNFDQYRQRLEEQITSLARDGYQKASDILRTSSGVITQAALDYAALTSKLKSASSAYDDLIGRERDQYNTSRDLILGLGKATDAQSFDQLAYLLGETTARATEYQDVLAQLKAQGLAGDLWNQLAQAGPESLGLAKSILQQGSAGIDQLNSLSGGLVDAADAMGSLVSQSMYQQGVNAMQAYIDGLQSQSTALESQLETIANTVLNKTAAAITPGNAGYSLVSAAPEQKIYQFGDITFKAESLGDIKTVQDFIAMLEQAPTTELVNQAGTVTS